MIGRKFLEFFLSLCILNLAFPVSIFAQDLENFRGTGQKTALIGMFNEFVEPSVEETLTKDLRRLLNRYSRTYSSSSISGFTMVANPNNQFLKPTEGEMGEPQKEFLQRTSNDNQVDIFVLGTVREASSGVEIELQLYDARIQTLSQVERESINLNNRSLGLEALVYRTMNYLDRDGFVHPAPQEFLKKPSLLQQSSSDMGGLSGLESDSFILPEELSGGTRLAGDISVGGEVTPFWEKWWFWTMILGSIATAGGISYYFLIVERDPSEANITLTTP